VKARSLAIPLLDALREEIEQLLIDLTSFEKILEILETHLQDKEQTYLRETGVLTVNGVLLYDPKDIEVVYRKTIGSKEDIVCQTISQRIFEELGVRLFDLYTFDTLRTKDLHERLLNCSMNEFRSGTQIDISTARKFLEQYPTVEQQEAQIKTTFEKSEPFLRFSQEQKRMGWEDKQEKFQRLVGIQGGNKPTDPAVASLLPMVLKTSTLTDKDIRPLNDSYHIFFVQEIGAFPLRLIEGMERMRTVYRAVAHSDKNPLHTHYDNRQFRDLIPPTHSETQIRHNLVLSKAMRLVREEENQVSGFAEVKFYYQDKQTGLDRTQVLGETWEDAEDYLLTDQNRKIAELLDEAIQRVGQQSTTKSDKQALYQQLMDYLSQTESTLAGGRDSEGYQKVEAAIADYVKTHGLFVAAANGKTANSAVSTNGFVSPTVANSSTANAYASQVNLEKFTKLVETCYRRGKPSTTEL